MKLSNLLFSASLIFIFVIAASSFKANAAGGVVIPLPAEKTRVTTLALYKIALRNFTYESEPEGEDTWITYDGNFPFVGDCEDFAFSLQRMVGAGSVFIAYLDVKGVPYNGSQKGNHAIFSYNGWYWDLSGKIYDLEHFLKKGNHIFFDIGDINIDTPHIVK